MIQHYVPRVYLKNFAIKRKKGYFVDVYDKTDERRFKTNIKNICGELHLYTLDKSKHKDPLIIENIYSRLFEPLYAEVYRVLINDKLVQINPLIRDRILGAVFQLYFRNSKILLEAIEFHTSNIRRIYQQTKKANQGAFKYFDCEFYILKDLELQVKEFEDHLRETFKLEHAKGFYNLMKKNDSHIICIYKVIDDSKFITCDNPLKCFNVDGSKNNPFLRVSQFFLPLNEKYCLYLYNDRTKNPHIIYRENVVNGKTSLVNGYMIDNSIRFVIGDYKEIERINQLNEIMNSEYETNDEKFIQLIKDIVVIMKIEKQSEEHLKIFYDIIELYEKNGKLTKADRQLFYRKAMAKVREIQMKNL